MGSQRVGHDLATKQQLQVEATVSENYCLFCVCVSGPVSTGATVKETVMPITIQMRDHKGNLTHKVLLDPKESRHPQTCPNWMLVGSGGPWIPANLGEVRDPLQAR